MMSLMSLFLNFLLGLLKDVPNPEILLAFTPSPTDIEMVMAHGDTL